MSTVKFVYTKFVWSPKDSTLTASATDLGFYAGDTIPEKIFVHGKHKVVKFDRKGPYVPRSPSETYGYWIYTSVNFDLDLKIHLINK